MNLELIKKYEKEFLHMLHGGKVLMGKKDPVTNTIKWYPSVLNPFVETSNTIVVVIDDIYCTYRKALYEGKTVEVYVLYGVKALDEQPWRRFARGCSTFDLPVECYRIKPEEPKFKVGDWVRQGTRVFQYSYKDLQYDKDNPTHCQNDEKWDPKGGEVCIFWDNSHTNEAIIARYSHSERSFYYPLRRPNTCYQNCMPFIGTLPPHMKDNK